MSPLQGVHSMHYWNTTTLKEEYTSSEPNLKGMKFSSLSNVCGIVSDMTLTIFNSETYVQNYQITVNSSIRDFAFNPYNNHVVISNGYNIEIYNLSNNGSFEKRIPISLYPVYLITFNIKSYEMILMSADDVNSDYIIDTTKIIRINLTDYTQLGNKSYSGNIPQSVLLSPDINYLSYYDNSINIISLKNWSLIYTKQIFSIYSFINETEIVTISASNIYFLNIITKRSFLVLKTPNSFKYSAHDQIHDLLYCTGLNNIYLWNISSQGWKYNRNINLFGEVARICFNSNFSKIGYYAYDRENNSWFTRIAYTNNNSEILLLNKGCKLDFHPIEDKLLIAYYNGFSGYNYYIYYTNNGTLLYKSSTIFSSITGCKYSLNGNYFGITVGSIMNIYKSSNYNQVYSKSLSTKSIIDFIFSKVNETQLIYYSQDAIFRIISSINGSSWILQYYKSHSTSSFYNIIASDNNKYYFIDRNKIYSINSDLSEIKNIITYSNTFYDYVSVSNTRNYILLKSTYGVDILGEKPISDIDISPDNGYYFTNFTFDSRLSTDDNEPLTSLQFKWDWGDGTHSEWTNSYTSYHIFPKIQSTKTYTVTLQVKDKDGLTGTSSKQVTINLYGLVPTAHFSVSPSSGGVYTHFTVNASQCSDNDDISKLQVRWDWENDGTWDTDWSTNKIAAHYYSSPGTKTIKMEVKDTDGFIDWYYGSVTVGTPTGIPRAHFSVSPTIGYTYTTFTFNASSCLDAEDDIEDLQVRWDWDSDGTWDTTRSSTKIITHKFSSPKTYAVTVQVNDTNGLVDNFTEYVTILSPTPSIQLEVSPHIGYVSTTFSFNAICYDNEDLTTDLTVRWDWENDGTWDTDYSISKTILHQYSSPGNYTVNAQVKDTTSLTDTDTIPVRVLSLNGPDSPTDISTSLLGSILGINISWKAPGSGDVAGYHLYRGVGYSPFELISSPSDTNHIDYDLVRGIPYYYQVAGYDSSGIEGMMSSVSVCIADLDFDMDGTGDLIDPDDDNDGFIDTLDDFPYNSTEWKDFDHDGMGDNSDPDDDNDGILDIDDPEPYYPFNHLEDLVNRSYHILVYMNQSSIPEIIESLNVLNQSYNDQIEELFNRLKDLESNLSDEISNLGDTISDEIFDLEKNLSDKISDLKSNVLSTIKGVNLSLHDKIEDLLDGQDDIIDYLAVLITGLNLTMNDLVVNMERNLLSGQTLIRARIYGVREEIILSEKNRSTSHDETEQSLSIIDGMLNKFDEMTFPQMKGTIKDLILRLGTSEGNISQKLNKIIAYISNLENETKKDLKEIDNVMAETEDVNEILKKISDVNSNISETDENISMKNITVLLILIILLIFTIAILVILIREKLQKPLNPPINTIYQQNPLLNERR